MNFDIELGKEDIMFYNFTKKNFLYSVKCLSTKEIRFFLTKLNEQEFIDYEQMRNEAFEIFKTNNYQSDDLRRVYRFGKNAKRAFFKGRTKTYKACLAYINKYKPLIEKFMPHQHIINAFENDYTYNNDATLMFYNSLKPLYSHKQELLEMCDKLEKLKITKFYYIEAPELSLSANRKVNNWTIEGFYTDGEQTYSSMTKEEFSSEIKYQANIQKANMILEYHKSSDTGYLPFYRKEPSLIVNNLLFDTNLLPTYEELYDFHTPTSLDYKCFEDFKALEKERENITTNVSELNNVSQRTNEILSLLESYTTKLERTKDMEEAKSIVTKLDTLKELLADVEKLRDAVIENNDVIDEEEIQKRLQKRYERSLYSHCCCC